MKVTIISTQLETQTYSGIDFVEYVKENNGTPTLPKSTQKLLRINDQAVIAVLLEAEAESANAEASEMAAVEAGECCGTCWHASSASEEVVPECRVHPMQPRHIYSWQICKMYQRRSPVRG